MAPFKKQKQKQKQKQTTTDRKALTEPQTEGSPAILQPASTIIPLELQQTILTIFANALQLADEVDLMSTIQQVKGHLFKRDFSSAFSNSANLAAYAFRWSPGRALAYAEIFASLDLPCWIAHWRPPDSKTTKVLCVGGGAGAELVALAALIRHLDLPSLTMHTIDIADWNAVLHKLKKSIEEAPPLSSYATAALKAANKPLLEAKRLHLQFDQQDVLGYSADQLQSVLVGEVTLVTIMFTLNELFTSSISKTTALLLALTDAMQPGSWLLVVDSPGSYSEVTLGQGTKNYPMHWLLDHALLKLAGNNDAGTSKWRKHLTDESRWFRINPKLKYPVELENMRYQIHLFEREDNETRNQIA